MGRRGCGGDLELQPTRASGLPNHDPWAISDRCCPWVLSTTGLGWSCVSPFFRCPRWVASGSRYRCPLPWRAWEGGACTLTCGPIPRLLPCLGIFWSREEAQSHTRGSTLTGSCAAEGSPRTFGWREPPKAGMEQEVRNVGQVGCFVGWRWYLMPTRNFRGWDKDGRPGWPGNGCLIVTTFPQGPCWASLPLCSR